MGVTAVGLRVEVECLDGDNNEIGMAILRM